MRTSTNNNGKYCSLFVIKQPTVIIIDDDEKTLDAFYEYLSSIDIPVLGIGYNGLDAVELYERHRPDIVFLDLMMPDYDGFYALERIRSVDPKAKVIAITGNTAPWMNRKLEELNPTKIIYKPYEVNEMLDIIESVRQERL